MAHRSETEPGWIWCERGGEIVGRAADGVVVSLGECLLTLKGASKRGGYPIVPMDIYTQRYLEAHPTPDTW